MARRRTTRSREGGQALVETALVLVIVLTVSFWIFELCMLMYTFVVMGNAAHEGVRFAAVKTGTQASVISATQDRVKEFAKTSIHDVSALDTQVEFPDGDAAPPNRVRVTVTYTFVPYLKVFTTPPTMHTYSEGRMIAQ